eukprot:762755-Pelagomonas_calceolata.AAC.1
MNRNCKRKGRREKQAQKLGRQEKERKKEGRELTQKFTPNEDTKTKRNVETGITTKTIKRPPRQQEMQAQGWDWHNQVCVLYASVT